jgi:hypothetical protein
MSESKLDILVMLVGSNPLPAFIVGSFLCGPRGGGGGPPKPNRIVLVYSGNTGERTGTEEYAREVKELLVTKTRVPEDAIIMVTVGSDARDFGKIQGAIKGGLKQACAGSQIVEVGSVHINITGGTKPMAVQTYAVAVGALEHGLATMVPTDLHSDGCRFFVSDVDPETRKLLVYELARGGGNQITPSTGKPCSLPSTGDLRDSVSLTFEELAKLYSIGVRDAGSSELRVGQSVDIDGFASRALHEDAGGSLRALCLAIRDDKTYQKEVQEAKGQKERPQRDLRIEQAKARLLERLEITTSADGQTVWSQFCAKYEPTLGDLVAGKRYTGDADRSAGKFVDFLTGKWLEEYVFSLVRKWFIGPVQSRRQCDARLGIKIDNSGRESELDVVLLQGYELTLFSCTTDSHIAVVKQKGFEAVFRADEFGGEHAKVVLVSNIPDERKGRPDSTVEGLKYDFKTFEATRNVHFITHQDLRRSVERCDGNGLEDLVKQWLR